MCCRTLYLYILYPYSAKGKPDANHAIMSRATKICTFDSDVTVTVGADKEKELKLLLCELAAKLQAGLQSLYFPSS